MDLIKARLSSNVDPAGKNFDYPTFFIIGHINRGCKNDDHYI